MKATHTESNSVPGMALLSGRSSEAWGLSCGELGHPGKRAVEARLPAVSQLAPQASALQGLLACGLARGSQDSCCMGRAQAFAAIADWSLFTYDGSVVVTVNFQASFVQSC